MFGMGKSHDESIFVSIQLVLNLPSLVRIAIVVMWDQEVILLTLVNLKKHNVIITKKRTSEFTLLPRLHLPVSWL